ncbi:hypothetical protein [Sphingomonas sp. RS2018]
MLALVILLSAQAVQPAPDAPPAAGWSSLPLLPIAMAPAELAPLSSFVATEVAAGRCAAATLATDGSSTLTVPVVVRRLPDGRVDAIRPQAIGCPTVEQYAVGLLQRLVTRPLAVPPPSVATWYRAGLTFHWLRPQATR